MQKGKARETIYNSVLESILNYEYAPECIINEGDLARKFNCSKAPVREALASLCDAKILRNIPRYGYEIVRISYEEVRDILQFRYLAEGGMMKKNLQNYKDADLDKLRNINEQYIKSIVEKTDSWKFNCEFHLTLMACSGNLHLQELLKVSMEKLKRACVQIEWARRCPEELSPDTVNHLKIVDALQARDICTALEFLRKDLSDFCEMHYDVGDWL